ncbi:uncharacterized protein B0I36DRAFT_238403 [Microdochium trichocladiopsis]|uniref:Uncharacterized protein n=1 Tax=Microdochium trichocladiopsis TaxID=1682393 RepID=A0A9P8YD40_9PEZI|nr:uncharacterized protein B0I36DRAFT_238403 [Microdochium trichocladiopsis]KAH7035720.1 hypothetical protein B0I36DRAFT_238403 [Microdochium trichocladiopsis]
MAPQWLEKFIVYADATPDPRIARGDHAATEVRYSVIPNSNRRILRIQGDTGPRWQVERQAVLGAWGRKCVVSRSEGAIEKIAVIDFHTFPRAYIEIEVEPHLQADQKPREIKVYLKDQQFDASDCSGGKLGMLRRKETGGKAYGAASWEMRESDEADGLVMSVAVDSTQANGTIGIWREGLGPRTIEELVLVGVSQIEQYKFMLRSAKTSGSAAAISGGTVAAGVAI